MSQNDRKYHLSGDELELLALSDDDVRTSVTKFSFEVEQMKIRIKEGETWQAIIQGHLYLDHIITSTLTEALVRPDAIEPKKMAFSHKLDLVHAMGLMPSPMVNAIRLVNSLRNSIAHKLDFEVVADDRDKLRSVCPPYVNEILKDVHNSEPPFSIDQYLKGFIVLADMARQHNAFRRLMERRARLNARKALRDIDKILKE